MIQYNNQNSFKEIHYNGHDIQKVYCDTGDLVWQKQSPTFDGKYKLTLNDSSTVSAECDSISAISQNEISAYSATVVSAEIGSCVTSIGDMAFYNCTALTSVTIPNSVTGTGYAVFTYCISLTSVTIPDSVTSINSSAFSTCSGLTNVTIPNSVTSIGTYAFGWCSSLTSLVIPSNVTVIDFGAFQNCSGLTGVTIEAVTPPRLSNANAFNNTNNCPIYVPSTSVDAYKSATNWSTYASRIQAIPNS